LQLGNGGTTRSLVGNITNNGVLAFNRSNDLTFGGMISGTGSVQQLGSGATLLRGANTYTGATTVNAGTLELAQRYRMSVVAADALTCGTPSDEAARLRREVGYHGPERP